MFYYVSWELGSVLTFWLSAHSIFKQSVSLGEINLKIEFDFLLLIQNMPLNHSLSTLFFKSLYDYAYVSPPCFSLSLQWKQIDFVVLCNLLCQSHSSSWESSLLTLFWITLNQEFSLFLKSVNWQMFLYRPLLSHRTKRKML